jgi:2'-hydroxyisoflavone reductase
MKLLVLGGTRFLRRHLVEAALARKDEVTLLNRGRTAPALFAEVERLAGDREGDLALLCGRSWDAVIDTCGDLPRVVRRSAQRLRDAVGRYLFVSSVSVYADAVAGQAEQSARAALPSPRCEDLATHYGAPKAACEDEVVRPFGDRAILLPPGLIVGPFDPTGRFTYRVQRVARGGAVLAAPSPEYPVQFIDARDLACFVLDPLERGRSGPFNAAGHAARLRRVSRRGVRRALQAAADFVWPAADFLAREGVSPWTDLPLRAGDDARGLNLIAIARALAAGLRHRPLAATVADTRQPAAASPLPDGVGLALEREAELLQRWRCGD